MIYHFTKTIGFDVDVNSVEEAVKASKMIESVIDNNILTLNDYMIGGGLHSGNFELAGYTADSDDEDVDVSLTPEEEFLNYLLDENYGEAVVGDKSEEPSDEDDYEFEDWTYEDYLEHDEKLNEDVKAYLDALIASLIARNKRKGF